MQFYSKLGLGICAIRRLFYVCDECIYMLDKTLDSWFDTKKQPRYQPVTNFSYWEVLGSFNNYNIITLAHRSTTSEAFEEIHQVVLDGISDNMDSLDKYDNYGSINTIDTLIMV